MPTLQTLIAFFGVAVVLALTPGPDNIFVLLQSAQRGWRAGMAVVVGLCAGLVVHTGAPVTQGPSLGRMVGRGMVMNLTNPKVLVFFLAFLPQFADPARGGVALQLMVLGVVFMVATLLVFGAIACFSGVFGTLLQRSARAQTVLNRVAGLVFLGLAVRLATVDR